MCPGTTIEVGKFHRTQNEYAKATTGKEKDFPITIIAPNTTLQCGSGGVDPNEGLCTFYGGFRQVVLKPLYHSPRYTMSDGQETLANSTGTITDEGIAGHILNDPDDNITLREWNKYLRASYNLNLSNVTIKNLYFTGTIDNIELIPGRSILVNQP